MWTSSHAANAPSEDRSASLVNVLLQPLPPNFDSETQLPPLEKEYSSLIRLNLWSVIDGHGGGCVATYASEVLLPHVAATISRALGCAIVSRGVCLVNGQLRDANALDLDGLIMTSDRSPANPNSIHYRSPCEASDDDDEGADTEVPDDEATQDSQEHRSQASTTGESIASSLLPSSPRAPTAVSSVAASVSSVKTSVKTAASPAACDAPIGTHSPSEVAAITRAITESFLAVDEGWINSIDPVATHQTSCQSNGRWNSGACALTVFSIQRLEWTNVSEEHQERELRSPAKKLGHDTSQNEDAARRRMLDYATRAKSASSLSTISSTSSLTTTDDRVNTSGLESEITETEGEDDDHSKDDEKTRRRNPLRRADRETAQKESLISAPGGCSCHCYRAYDALLYTAHVGDCRAVMLGPAPPRTIKVHGSATGHPEATDDESRHHSSDETECLSSSDHDADSSDDDDIDLQETPATATTSSYMSCMLRPARRQSRRLAKDDFGTNAPFIALPPLEGFQSVEVEIDSDGDLPGRACHSGMLHSDSSSSSSSSQDSHDDNPIIQLTPVTRPIDLTTDHSAYNPAEVTAVLRRCNNAPRAIAAGVGGGIKRVAGSLAVTRALGDAYLKTPSLSFFPYKRHAPYITARPEVNCRPIVKDGDKVLILATDGVWERSSGEDVLRWVRNFYAERIARAERRQNRRQNQSERCSNDGSVRCKRDENSDERNNGLEMVGCKSDMPRSPSPPTKRRKLRSNRWGLAPFGSQRNSNVSDVIVRRILNKVRRTRNISSLHALMSLPPGRARRSKHDDITSCVVDLSAFVL
jgi:serine/threonine protein phosphatase PrpC